MKNENEIPYWKQQELKAKEKKAHKEKFLLAGTIVKRYNEYGVIIPAPEPDELDQEYYIAYDKPKIDWEGLYGLPYEEAPNYKLKYINLDGTLIN